MTSIVASSENESPDPKKMRIDTGGGAPDVHEPYFKELKAKFDVVYQVSKLARARNFDPAPFPESIVTSDVAERVEKAVGPEGIATKIRELASQMPRELVALKIAEVIALRGYGSANPTPRRKDADEREEAAEQAVRTAAAILDEGVTAAPIQGISSVRIRQNPDGTKHLAVYFAGPIRSAGGTDMALILVIANFVKDLLGLDKYKGTEAEANRFVEELRLYEREVARFQYHVSDQELHEAIMYLPIEVNGVETDRVEVSAYRNIPRIDTDRVRGGALRVVNDGLIGRSKKVLKLVEGLSIEGWNWLQDIKTSTAETADAQPVSKDYLFMEDIVGGRPIFSFPNFKGGFRLRYGRARNTGLAAVGVHPATMIVMKKFIAVGTQLKLQMPGKAGIAAVVDSIEPPVVRLKDGSVIRLADPKEAERLSDSIEKVLFIGDLLVGFGEFLENNHMLVPSGIVEGWWSSLTKLHALTDNGGLTKFARQVQIGEDRLESFLRGQNRITPTPGEAIRMAKGTGIPLHPRYTFFWEDIAPTDYDYLRAKLADPKCTTITETQISTENNPKVKAILETLCVPHSVTQNQIVVKDDAEILCECLGLKDLARTSESGDVFGKILAASKIVVKTKAPVHVGVRMGRPEKAKRREMKPVVHSLFPIGFAGGSRRNIIAAAEAKEVISIETAYRKCEKCGHVTYKPSCEECGGNTVKAAMCPRCGGEDADDESKCRSCKVPLQAYTRQDVHIRDLIADAKKNLKLQTIPELVKGAQGLTSETKVPEPLEKGILRAKYDLSIFKDGTIRFDATNAPLTHFTPAEIGVSLEKLRSLGYNTDMNDDPLTSPTQYCALKVHDVIITETGGDYLVNVAQFIDELLESYYGVPAFYKVKTRDELVGHLLIGLSPHTSVGVIGRLLGFTKAKVCFAHPFWHATKRRDCFSGGEIIPIFDGEKWSMRTIRSIVEEKLANGHFKQYPGGEQVADGDGQFTLALNPKKMRFDMKRVIAYSKHPPQNHVVELETKDGRRVITTGPHKFPTVNEGGLEKTEAFKVTRVIEPTTLEIPEIDVDRIDLLKLNDPNMMVRGCGATFREAVQLCGGITAAARQLGITTKRLGNYLYRDSAPPWLLQQLKVPIPDDVKLSTRNAATEIPRIVKVEDNFLTLLGFYTSEGYARHQQGRTWQVSFCNAALENDVKKLVKTIFGLGVSVNGAEQTVSSRLVYQLFANYLSCGRNAHEKRVPKLVFSLPLRKIRSYLRGYFEGDGTLAIESTAEVNCTSVSPGLLHDVEFLLLRFGINTSWAHDMRIHNGRGAVGEFYRARGKRRVDSSYKLRMYANDARTFCEKIGFYGDRKAELSDQIVGMEFGTRSQFIGQTKIEPIKSTKILGNSDSLYDLTVEDHHNLLADGISAGNCDGDEDSVSLALDMLLNFSKSFLPAKIGGIMDAPILLNLGMNPKEIARQAFNIESEDALPLRFYEEAAKQVDPKSLTPIIETVAQRLGSPTILGSLGFSHEVADVGAGNPESAYKTLTSMLDKVTEQLNLAEQIRAVNASDVAKRVLSTHFMRDLSGNLKAFSSQRLRCTKCNTKYRRIPLMGVCQRCGGKLSLTVYQGGVEKYMKVAKDLVQRYDLGKYSEQRLMLIDNEIHSLFSETGKAVKIAEEKKQKEDKKMREVRAQPTLAQFV